MSVTNLDHLSSETTVFVQHYTDQMATELGASLIDQFGGEEAFIANYQEVVDGGVGLISGFKDNNETTQFFEKNKAMVVDFLETLPDLYGLSDVNEVLVNRDKISDIFTNDELMAIMDDPNDTDYDWLVADVTCFVVEVFCDAYESFLSI